MEVVAIYTADPLLCGDRSNGHDGWRESGEDDGFSCGDVYPPPSIAPRLHCLSYRKLGSSFPLLVQVEDLCSAPTDYSSDVMQQLLQDLGMQSPIPVRCSEQTEIAACVRSLQQLRNPATVMRLRQLAVELLSEALGGDALAAQYVLLASLSRCVGRHSEEGAVLGMVTVQLCGVQPQAISMPVALKTALSQFVPRCVTVSRHCAPVTITN